MKQKACKVCRATYAPRGPLQVVCSPVCALQHASKVREKKAKAAQVEEKRQDRVKKERMKGIPDLIREADRAFAVYVRLRDRLAGYPCISSGKPLDWSGNAVDSGHFRSRGAASAIRYHQDNCHAQTKHDNLYLSGNAVEYRKGLIERIGLERVEALEAMTAVHKWTREELTAIKAEYMAKAKELKKRLDYRI